MHIVFLTNEYPNTQNSHGGIGTFVQNLARKLVINNIKVSVVGISNTYKSSHQVDCGVDVFRIAKSKVKFGKFIFNSIRINRKLTELNSKNCIDVVEGSELSFAFLPKKTFYKKVIRMHGGHHFFAITLGNKTAFWRSYQEKKSFSNVDALLSVSEFVGNKTKEFLNFKKPFKTIYNFIDFDKFKSDVSNKVTQNSILFIGTVCKKKGVKELVQAFEIVKSKIPNAVLNIVGRDWDDNKVGSYTKYVKTFISHNNNDSVKFHGTVPYNEISKFISESHICVYPSHMESFGLTLIEAMTIGKPIVASDIEPFKEIMTNNSSGMLCNPFSPEDIAEKIIELLTNTNVAKKMALNAKKEVEEKFNSNRIIEENINFYKSII